jgi:hypothetical protein
VISTFSYCAALISGPVGLGRPEELDGLGGRVENFPTPCLKSSPARF